MPKPFAELRAEIAELSEQRDALLSACKASLPIIEADIQVAFINTWETDGKREHAQRLLTAAIKRATNG